MSLSSDEIRAREFTSAPDGFAPAEVRAYLNHVADEMARMAAAPGDGSGGAGPLAHVGDRVNEIVDAAQQSADAIVQDAESWAMRHKTAAQRDVETMRADAEHQKRLADEAAVATRSEADGYAAQVRSEADGYSTQLRAEAEGHAARVKAEGAAMARQHEAKVVGEANQRLAEAEAALADSLAVRQALISRVEGFSGDLGKAKTHLTDPLPAVAIPAPTTIDGAPAQPAASPIDAPPPDAAVAAPPEAPTDMVPPLEPEPVAEAAGAEVPDVELLEDVDEAESPAEMPGSVEAPTETIADPFEVPEATNGQNGSVDLADHAMPAWDGAGADETAPTDGTPAPPPPPAEATGPGPDGGWDEGGSWGETPAAAATEGWGAGSGDEDPNAGTDDTPAATWGEAAAAPVEATEWGEPSTDAPTDWGDTPTDSPAAAAWGEAAATDSPTWGEPGSDAPASWGDATEPVEGWGDRAAEAGTWPEPATEGDSRWETGEQDEDALKWLPPPPSNDQVEALENDPLAAMVRDAVDQVVADGESN